MRRLTALLIALVVLTGAPQAWAAKVGEPAPPFRLTTLDGESISLESLRGKVVLVNYWATWCAPCRVELPELEAYMRRHRGADLVIIAVEVGGQTPKSALKRLGAELSFPMTLRLRGRGYGRIKGAVPTNYVIDKQGVVRFAEAGAFNAASLEKIVTPLLREAAPAVVAAP